MPGQNMVQLLEAIINAISIKKSFKKIKSSRVKKGNAKMLKMNCRGTCFIIRDMTITTRVNNWQENFFHKLNLKSSYYRNIKAILLLSCNFWKLPAKKLFAADKCLNGRMLTVTTA